MGVYSIRAPVKYLPLLLIFLSSCCGEDKVINGLAELDSHDYFKLNIIPVKYSAIIYYESLIILDSNDRKAYIKSANLKPANIKELTDIDLEKYTLVFHAFSYYNELLSYQVYINHVSQKLIVVTTTKVDCKFQQSKVQLIYLIPKLPSKYKFY